MASSTSSRSPRTRRGAASFQRAAATARRSLRCATAANGPDGNYRVYGKYFNGSHSGRAPGPSVSALRESLREPFMSKSLFDGTIVATAEQAVDFIGNILESSTEYSIIGKDLDGLILLWNEGARRLYGYAPEEVVGKANSPILPRPEDFQT